MASARGCARWAGVKSFARAAARAAPGSPFELQTELQTERLARVLAGVGRLSRTDRLRGAAAFARVFHSGKRLDASRIEVLVAPAADGSGRVGYVIGRKQLPRAVDRNRLRRLLREALRARRATTKGLDIVLRLRQSCPAADLSEIAAEAGALLDSMAPPRR
jgi:ribonuclease P protein component